MPSLYLASASPLSRSSSFSSLSSLYQTSSAASSSFSLSSCSSPRSSYESSNSRPSYESSSPRNSYDSSSSNNLFRLYFPASLNGAYGSNYEERFTRPLDFSSDADEEYAFARQQLFENRQTSLKSESLDRLAGKLKELIADSKDFLHPKFVFDLVKPELERLSHSPSDLLDVLKSTVQDGWVSHEKTRNKLEGIILLYKKRFPNTCSEKVPEGMKGIYRAFKEKKEALTHRARRSNASDETALAKIDRQRKEFLHKVTIFFERFREGSYSGSGNQWLLAELIAKPLIVSAIHFMAAQYIFPSIQRRWL